MSWWSSRNPFYQDLWTLMNQTAKHCRCVAIYWDWKPGQMKVAGLPADLDYFDLLFTQLMLEHAKRMNPQPNPRGEVGEEVYKLRQAGVSWPTIVERMFKAGLVELTAKERSLCYDQVPLDWDYIGPTARESIKNRLANANRRYVKANGLQYERNYVNPRVYQRSFSEGFVNEITSRMRWMRGEAEKGDDNHMALALRDIRQIVNDWVGVEFPMPENNEDESKAVSKEPAFSVEAYYAGKREGSNVNIAASPNKGVGGKRKRLES
jgi:hypothetical protein